MQPNEEMKAMARRVAAGTKVGVAPQQILDGLWDRSPVVQAALAAIMETQEACAKLAEGDPMKLPEGRVKAHVMYLVRQRQNIATAIRTGEHYAATIGEDIGGGRG